VSFPPPTSLSPSRVDAFTSCPLAFRFASIEKLPEPPSPYAVKGTLVHRALELLFCEEPQLRTPELALSALDRAITEVQGSEEWRALHLSADEEADFLDDAEALVRRYLRMEDPREVKAIGLELRLEARVGALSLRGIIDRLELDADGRLVVVDYKTGRPPYAGFEQGRLNGVHFYAFLCEQAIGHRPAMVRLYYLSTGEIIETRPTDQSTRFLPVKAEAVWRAIERACATEDFRPRPSSLCGSCAYQRWCPAFGGDPGLAAQEAPAAFGLTAA
jgi:putative RecB family exonuclease